jgi:hypothetical protein
MPVGLPTKLSNHVFHVVGCFCSLECAAAHNFSQAHRVGLDECLNRHTLLNLLSQQLGGARTVSPAPDRMVLSAFGGHLSIDEFREVAATGKLLLVNQPPMLMQTQQVEEVPAEDLRSEYRYIPLDDERVSRIQERLRIRRNKPLVNFHNTLDHAMNLRVVAVGPPPHTGRHGSTEVGPVYLG